MSDEILDEGIKFGPSKDLNSAREIVKLRVKLEEETKAFFHGQIALWALVALQLIGTAIQMVQYEDSLVNTVNVATIGLYCLAAIITYKKPTIGLALGLSLLILLQLIGILDDPWNVIRGLLVKIIIIYYLIVGLSAARKLENTKNMLSYYGILD